MMNEKRKGSVSKDEKIRIYVRLRRFCENKKLDDKSIKELFQIFYQIFNRGN